jgi:hypothetical protein
MTDAANWESEVNHSLNLLVSWLISMLITHWPETTKSQMTRFEGAAGRIPVRDKGMACSACRTGLVGFSANSVVAGGRKVASAVTPLNLLAKSNYRNPIWYPQLT